MKAALAASFGRAADSYAAHANVQLEMASWLAEWLPSARRGRVLELGAGPGVFTKKLHPWSGEVIATDAVPAMCAVGRTAAPHAQWQAMRAESPEPGPWDWIVSSSMLQWIESPAAALAAWRRGLSPEGRVLAGWFVEESLPELRVLARSATPLTWRTAAEWRELIIGAGLRILRDERSIRAVTYPSARAFLRALHEIGAAPERRLGPGEMRRLLREYTTRFADGQGVRATWTFYRMEAALDLTTPADHAHSL